jgi:four helix bundle protein
MLRYWSCPALSMSKLSSFRQLEVWQLGMTLCERVYAVSAMLPNSEFDLRRQLRKASVSIPSNIAEGYKRRTRPAYINHVSIAAGSQGELDTELELAVRLKLLPPEACAEAIDLTDRVGRMLWRLEESLAERRFGP